MRIRTAWFTAATMLLAGCAHLTGLHDFASKTTPPDSRVTLESGRGVVIDEVDGRSWFGSGTGTFVLDPGSHELLARYHLFEGDVVKFRLEATPVRFDFAPGKRYEIDAKVDEKTTQIFGFEIVEKGPNAPPPAPPVR